MDDREAKTVRGQVGETSQRYVHLICAVRLLGDILLHPCWIPVKEVHQHTYGLGTTDALTTESSVATYLRAKHEQN